MKKGELEERLRVLSEELRKKRKEKRMKKAVVNLNEGEPVDEMPERIGEIRDEPEELGTEEFQSVFNPVPVGIGEMREETLRGILSGLEDRVARIEERLGIKR